MRLEKSLDNSAGRARRAERFSACAFVLALALAAGAVSVPVRGAGQSSGQGLPDVRRETVMAQAQEQLKRGDAAGAARILSIWAKAHPADAAARLMLASVLARLHRYPEAAAAVAGVPAPAPLRERIGYERLKASIDLGLGNAKAAARDMEQALTLAPEDAGLALATGMAESEAGAWPEAATHLQQAIEGLPGDSPGRADLYYDLALAEFNAGQLDAALAAAEHAKRLADGAALESLMGDIQEARGSNVAAAHSYQAAVTLAPDQEQYRLTLGLELLRHETFEPALAVFKQTAELFPRSRRARVAEGLTYYFLEQYPQAIQALLEAARLNSPVSPASKGSTPELALDYLGEIQLQQPVTPDPAAIEQICRYADSHSRGAGAAELAYCGALELRLEHDRGDAAPSRATVARLRQAVQRMPSNATARCSLGQALEWTHEWWPAEREMEACLRLKPDSVEGHYRMANIARHLGQSERAQQELKLHDAAQQRLVQSNAARDSTLKKFLYTMGGSAAKDSTQP
ncbi:MAG TPA: tetratricopeptide repeat protein [Terriglobia bacterium]|nr:tetratricopeptide repeat protein [Terriglobia bacterium]